MKKIMKITVLATVLSVLFASVCFAQEPTKIYPDLTEKQFIDQLSAHSATVLAQAASVENSMADKKAAEAHLIMIANQLKSYNRTEADNYILYRKKRVDGLKENERIKKEIYNNYVSLSRSNYSFSQPASIALAEYQNAMCIRMAEEAAVARCTADFDVLYPR